MADHDDLLAAARAIYATTGVQIKVARHMPHVLRQLLRAKHESDRGFYAAKHTIMRDLIRAQPHAFRIDSERHGIVGVTHLPTHFKMHLPKRVLPTTLQRLTKHAHSPTLRALGQLTSFIPGPTNAFYGGPSPLTATIGGGLLGAGLGYGAGVLGEKFLPEKHFQPGRLRRFLALLGGAAGAAPGAWWGSVSHRHHPHGGGLKAWLSSWPQRPQDIQEATAAEKHLAKSAEYCNTASQCSGVVAATSHVTSCEAATKHAEDRIVPAQWRGSCDYNVVWSACNAALTLLPEVPSHYKQALDDAYGLYSVVNVPSIPAQQFSSAVWQDEQTPMNIRSATTNLVGSAAQQRGTRFVSPADIGRVAMGAGSGYLSGMLVGKTLGALAGLRPEAQQQLQQLGTWAGILTNVVPLAFG